MTYEEIFNSEKRNVDDYLLIHLYYEGTWWRAYEWSAYLAKYFPSNLNENEKLKVNKKNIKDIEEGIVYVGLQLPSFDKYFPNVYDNNYIEQIDDKHMVINVKMMFKDIKYEDYENIFYDWKNTFVIHENKRNNINKKQKNLKNDNIFDGILKEIINYPLANKTLIENTIFLGNMQNKILNMVK